MVFYFTSNVVPSVYTIYMGKDKYENEDLIKYGWPEDIWFHVDKLSSAHVYLRLHKGQTMDDIPKEVLIDCAQLVKANSIQGCKMNNVNVVYTPWANLKKTADMDVGQIGFHRQKDVKLLTVEKKVNEILNRLEKTKVERFPDLAAEKEARDREERNEKKAQIQEMKRKEKEEMKKKKELEELRSYSSLMKAENMSSNQLAFQLSETQMQRCFHEGAGVDVDDGKGPFTLMMRSEGISNIVPHETGLQPFFGAVVFNCIAVARWCAAKGLQVCCLSQNPASVTSPGWIASISPPESQQRVMLQDFQFRDLEVPPMRCVL